MLQERYKSFDKGIGAKIEKGTATLEELEVVYGIWNKKRSIIAAYLTVFLCFLFSWKKRKRVVV